MDCAGEAVTNKQIVMDELHRLYKSETGNSYSPSWSFYLTRERGKWVLDVSDQDKMEQFGAIGVFDVPDLDYVAWLQEELLKRL